MLVSAFWTTDSFTGNVVHSYSTGNLHTPVTDPLYRTVAMRTVVVALSVTVIDAVHRVPDRVLHEPDRITARCGGSWSSRC